MTWCKGASLNLPCVTSIQNCCLCKEDKVCPCHQSSQVSLQNMLSQLRTSPFPTLLKSQVTPSTSEPEKPCDPTLICSSTFKSLVQFWIQLLFEITLLKIIWVTYMFCSTFSVLWVQGWNWLDNSFLQEDSPFLHATLRNPVLAGCLINQFISLTSHKTSPPSKKKP